jgi:chromosome segregation ATPase
MINMSDKLDLVLKEIQEIKKEIQGIKTEQKQQNDLTTQLIHIVSATNEKVSTIQKTLEQQEKHLKKLDGKFETLAIRSVEHEAEIRRWKNAQ